MTQKEYKEYAVDLCIIGAGAGGLSIAAGAASLGRSVVIYEAAKMGGDCLNHGCVPSKSLIAAAKHAHAFQTGKPFGVGIAKPKIDFEAVKAHVKNVIETIAPVDSQERFEGLGCIVIREPAKFAGKNTVVSANTCTTAKRIIIATGSQASAPPITGLDTISYYTNEEIFTIDTLPVHLLIIGSGPIGLELGQAFNRLGSKVEIIDIAPPLRTSEPDHAQVLIDSLKAEGVIFHAPIGIGKVRKIDTGIAIDLDNGTSLTGTHLLVAAGRKPVIDNLDLDKADIKRDRAGILTDERLRSSNKRVYAVGDSSGRGGLTHIASQHASLIIRNFYFVPFLKARTSNANTPAVIYTQPELAMIGKSESQARAQYKDVKIVTWEFAENDRALAESSTQGGVKIIGRKNGEILGASIVGEQAGELIQIIGLAMANKMKIIGLTKLISPYPSRAEAVKRAASSWYIESVFGNNAKKLAKLMSKFH